MCFSGGDSDVNDKPCSRSLSVHDKESASIDSYAQIKPMKDGERWRQFPINDTVIIVVEKKSNFSWCRFLRLLY